MKVVKGGTVSRLLKDVPVPEMFHARQTFPREVIAPKDIPAVVFREMAQPQFAEKIKPGMSIAVTAGSRGIRNVDIITKAVVDFVKQKAHLLLLYRQWEVTEELRQRGRLRFWKASESQKKQWDVLSVLLWRLWSWAIPVWDAELL